MPVAGCPAARVCPRARPRPRCAAVAHRSGSATYSGDVWFEGWQDVELSESSVFIPEYDQTLTLLHCTDQDELEALPRADLPERDRDDADDALLKPLDGYPGWAGSGRR